MIIENIPKAYFYLHLTRGGCIQFVTLNFEPRVDADLDCSRTCALARLARNRRALSQRFRVARVVLSQRALSLDIDESRGEYIIEPSPSSSSSASSSSSVYLREISFTSTPARMSNFRKRKKREESQPRGNAARFTIRNPRSLSSSSSL